MANENHLPQSQSIIYSIKPYTWVDLSDHMLLCCLWEEEEESLWNVSCKAYHKKDQRQNSLLLLKIQEILKRDMDMDFTLVCIVLIWFKKNIALSMLKKL